MPFTTFTDVQSLDPNTSVPVATTSVSQGAVQHMHLRDSSAEIIATVGSNASSNPLFVALVGATGLQLTTIPVTGAVQTSLSGQVFTTASIAGVPTVVASVIGQPTVTASVPGPVAVTQQTSPWIVRAGSSGDFIGTVQASVTGQLFTTASLAGTPSVVASVIGQPTVTASIAGTPSVVASVIGVPAVVASVIGVPTFVGSVQVTQANTATPFTVIVTSQPPISVSGQTSVWLGNTPSVVTVQANTAQPYTVIVTSIAGAGTSPTSVFAIQQGSWLVIVTSMPAVSVAGQTSVWVGNTPSVVIAGQTAVTASIAGVPAITGSVQVQGQVASGTTWAGNPVGAGGFAADYAQTSITQVGCGTLVPFLADRMGRQRIAVDTGTIGITGNVGITQSGSFTVTVPSLAVAQSGSWTALVTQQNTSAPFTVIVTSQPAINVAGQTSVWVGNTPSVVVAGQVTATVSVAGVPSVTVTGSVQVTQANTAAPFTVIVTSLAGAGTSPTSVFAIQQGSWQVIVTSMPPVSVAGQTSVWIANTPAVVAVQGTSAWVTQVASIEGPALAVTLRVVDANTVAVQHLMLVDASSDVRATVRSYAGGKPLAVALTDTTGAHLSALATTQGGSLTVTVPSLAVAQQGSFTVLATQQTSPWVTLPASTGDFQGFVVASVAGTPVVQPFAQPTSAFLSVISATITTSERILVGSAPGAGARYYLTALLVTVQSVATTVDVLDGTTAMWRGYAAAGGGGFAISFPYPLRQPTANTSLGIQFTTSGAAGTASVAGFVGA